MNYHKYVFLATFFISSSFVTAQKNQKGKPNVLMLVVDDWNDMVGSFGHNQAITPNLNKLSKEGISFINNQTPAGYCTPSRTALLTGVAPWRSGCYGNQPHHFNMPDQKTLPALFKENGYAVYGGGKVFHHMPGYLDMTGYDKYFHWNPEQKKKGWGLSAWDDNSATPQSLPYSNIAKATYDNFDIAALPNEMEEEMADTKMVDWSIELLKKNYEKPFFITAGLYAPHKPNFVPQKYFDMYPLADVILPEIYENDEDDLPPLVQDIIRRRDRHTHQGVISVEDGWRKTIQGYLAAVSYADAQLGRILDQLNNSPYSDNTIIVFWSDNGYHLGEKKCWAKHTLWERTTNVPMIWAGPSLSKDKVHEGVTSLLDIYPTLVNLCKLNGAQKMDGVNISYALKTQKSVRNRAVITALKSGDAFSVFTNQWHYISHKSGEAEELYDVNKDPNEWHNLAQNGAYSKVLSDLREKLPDNPAPPATDKDSLELVVEGKSFKWVKKRK